MDQLAADLNNALNDANMLTSSMSYVTMTSMNSTKNRRRRKRHNQNDQMQRTNASGSTTPENYGQRLRRRSLDDQDAFLTDPDDIDSAMSKNQNQCTGVVSESDSPSHNDAIRRRRRPFKKPFSPVSSMIVSSQESSMKKSTRSSNMKLLNFEQHRSSSVSFRRRRPKTIERDRVRSIPSLAASLPIPANSNSFVGKRKRSRAIQEDFRLRNASSHDYDMNCVDESTLANISSGSSLNLSDSDKEPYLTSNEADDEQSDWPRDESTVPKLISWWDEKVSDQESDHDEKMLTTTDGTLQKIVNGALNMMLASSKASLQNRIKYLANREMLTGHRRYTGSKTADTNAHSKRSIRFSKDARRSHHNSYNHKRVKSDDPHSKSNEPDAPIDSANIGHQLLEKFGWKPGEGLGLNQNGIVAPIQINYRGHRQGLGYENTPMETGERLENDPTSITSSQTNEI